MSTTGPFLYDDGPAALHTGTPRRRGRLLLAMCGGTVLIAVLMVVTLPLVKGSPDKQARQAVGSFLQAMQHADSGAAHEMLCDKEQARLTAAQVVEEYGGPPPGRVVSASKDPTGGTTAELVRVRWADGTTSRFTVIPEDGAHICGVRAGS